MEFHIRCDKEDISRYVFCCGSHRRARRLTDLHFEDSRVVSESRGYIVYTGTVDGVMMTCIGTGMGGPVMAIALEELAHMGADTFIRVGSCGVFQPNQGSGDVIIANGAYRGGSTANAYLAPAYPAVPTFALLHGLVNAADAIEEPYEVGVVASEDAFYAPSNTDRIQMYVNTGVIGIEMECDTLFILGSYRGWRTGAILVSDGAPGEIKSGWGDESFRRGEEQAIRIARRTMVSVARSDS